jgi:hypothetical protein
METMVTLTFPHTELFIILGPEGPKTCVVDFITKDDKIAIKVLWKGKMIVDYQTYNTLCDTRILEFLNTHGISINTYKSKDFGKCQSAIRKTIEDFFNEQTKDKENCQTDEN